MASITLNNIHKTYDDGFHAVKGVDLDIADGEFVILVGPSGCGKSTLLRMVVGLEDITDGELRIGERRVNEVAPKDRNLAMVFQNYALYPHLTVFENIAFPLRLNKQAKFSEDQIKAKVAEASKMLELDEHLDRKPGNLSGGQRQRVAMGRAIVREADAFLFDEPLSNLDAKLRGQMRAEIAQMQRRLGITSIYVTHDQTEAMTLGDRVAVLKKGELQQVASPRELYEQPINLFVAGFIGSPQMNFFNDAKLVKDGDKYFVEVQGVRVELPEDKQAALKTRENVPTDIVLGIRPPHINLTNDGIAAKIDVCEMMGSEMHLHVNAGGVDVVIIVPTANADMSGIKMNADIKFSFHPNLMHLFNKETGDNLF